MPGRRPRPWPRPSGSMSRPSTNGVRAFRPKGPRVALIAPRGPIGCAVSAGPARQIAEVAALRRRAGPARQIAEVAGGCRARLGEPGSAATETAPDRAGPAGQIAGLPVGCRAGLGAPGSAAAETAPDRAGPAGQSLGFGRLEEIDPDRERRRRSAAGWRRQEPGTTASTACPPAGAHAGRSWPVKGSNRPSSYAGWTGRESAVAALPDRHAAAAGTSRWIAITVSRTDPRSGRSRRRPARR